MKWRLLAVAAAALAITTSCMVGSSDDTGATDPASPEAGTDSPAPEGPAPQRDTATDEAEQACTALVEDDLLSVGADGLMVDDATTGDWAGHIWGVAGIAARSDITEVQVAAQAIVDYFDANQGAFVRVELSSAALQLVDACKGAGFIDVDWVVLAFPGQTELEAYAYMLALAAPDLSLPNEDWIPSGLDACQRIADHHNATGAVPDSDWLIQHYADHASEHGITDVESVSITLSAVTELCPRYANLLQDAGS